MDEQGLHAFADLLRPPDVRLTVLTGAGVSAASGVPTFRGPEGLWRRFRPEELATPEAFARDPVLVWEWYAWRREKIAAARPNRAHEVLAAWSRRLPGCTVVTQNVDGLHERAGTAGLLRFHGTLWELRCAAGCPGLLRDERVPLPELPPPCPACGGPLRPAVTWYGETIDAEVLERSWEAAARCHVFVLAGTSAQVHPAASLLTVAARAGAATVEVGPERTVASDLVRLMVPGKAEEVLDAVERRLTTPG